MTIHPYMTIACKMRADDRIVHKCATSPQNTIVLVRFGDLLLTCCRLSEYLLSLKKKKVVVFLDELSWMDNMNSRFLSAFSYFWNNWNGKKVLLKLFVCGSATAWMIDKLIGDKGGLYGRVSRQIYLAPFTLCETEQFLNDVKKMNYDKMQVLDTYMIFGGIPYYLDMLNRNRPLTGNVDNLFFDTDAPLRTEYDFLFRSLFVKSNNYRNNDGKEYRSQVTERSLQRM